MNRQEELPTLPIGTVLQYRGWQDREVIHSAPGYCLVMGPARRSPFVWLDGAWRMAEGGAVWEVKPERIEFQANQRDQYSWMVQSPYSDRSAVSLDMRALPDHMNAGAVARAIAGLLTDMANGVQS